MSRIDEINNRLDNRRKRGLEGYAAREDFQNNAESDIEHLLSIIEQQDNLLKLIDSVVEEAGKPPLANESGATRLIVMGILVQKYSYYKQHPNELYSYLKAMQGEIDDGMVHM